MALCLAALGLIGHGFNQSRLLTLVDGWPAMSLATALALTTLALAIACQHYFNNRNWLICLGPVLSMGVSVTSLGVILFNFMPTDGQNLLTLPKLISSPFTAIALLALNVSFLLQTYRPTYRAYVLSQFLAICVLALSLASLTGYVLHLPTFYMSQHGLGMALHTTLAVIALAIGLFNANDKQGWAALFYQPTLGSWLLRAALPIMGFGLLAMLTLGSWGQQFNFKEILPFLFAAILMGTLFWLARVAFLVNQTHQERDTLERQFEVLFEGNPDAILVVDAQGRILKSNQALERLSGYNKESLLGQSMEMLMPPHLRVMHTALRLQYQSAPQPRQMGSGFEISLLRKDGSLCPVDISLSPLQMDNTQWVIAAVRDLTQRKQLEEKIERLSDIAVHDPLTGLANRVLLDSFLEQACNTAARHKKMVAVCYLDLDGFKQVNDQGGHLLGDKLLIEASYRIKSGIRSADMVARVGGDEFIVVLSMLDSKEDAFAIADKLIQTLNRTYHIDNLEWRISASAGVALYPLDGIAPKELILIADTRLIRAKDLGKNRYLWQ